MDYSMTKLEEDIQNLYHELSITDISPSSMKYIAKQLQIKLKISDVSSQALNYNGEYYIFINNKLSAQEQWQEFGHEIGHRIKHVGDQKTMFTQFRCLQEWQADNFMYHFCVPTFMLLKLNISNYCNIEYGISFISETFNVTDDFARKRLQMFKSQMLQAKSDRDHRIFMDSLYPKAPPYSEETTKLLKQLELLQTKKKEKVVD